MNTLRRYLGTKVRRYLPWYLISNTEGTRYESYDTDFVFSFCCFAVGLVYLYMNGNSRPQGARCGWASEKPVMGCAELACIVSSQYRTCGMGSHTSLMYPLFKLHTSLPHLYSCTCTRLRQRPDQLLEQRRPQPRGRVPPLCAVEAVLDGPRPTTNRVGAQRHVGERVRVCV